MAVFGIRRRINAGDAEKATDRARKEEEARLAQVRRDEMQRDIFQTTEGQGIAEAANISLGFDDEEEDDLFDFGTGTGLVI